MEEVGKFKEWFYRMLDKKIKQYHVTDRTMADILLHEAYSYYHRAFVLDKLDGKDG